MDQQPVSPHTLFLLRGKAASARTGQWDFFDVIGSYGGEEVLPPLAALGY